MLIILVFILVFAAGFALPWWIVAVICFAASFWLAQSSSQAFWSSFLAVFIAWVLLALINSVPNNHILANRVATLFHLPNWMAILGVTGLVGAIVGGFAGLSGYYFEKAFIKPTPPNMEPKKANT